MIPIQFRLFNKCSENNKMKNSTKTVFETVHLMNLMVELVAENDYNDIIQFNRLMPMQRTDSSYPQTNLINSTSICIMNKGPVVSKKELFENMNSQHR